jgi:hypothetical protein
MLPRAAAAGVLILLLCVCNYPRGADSHAYEHPKAQVRLGCGVGSRAPTAPLLLLLLLLLLAADVTRGGLPG